MIINLTKIKGNLTPHEQTIQSNFKSISEIISVIDTSESRIQVSTCSTSSATAEKAFTISDITALAAGQEFLLKCSNANTAGTPTININSLGAKALKFKAGILVDATHPAPINTANREMRVMYDGTDFIIQENAVYISAATAVSGENYYTFTHGLGIEKIKVSVYFSTSSDMSNKSLVPGWSYQSYYYGCQVDSITSTQLRVYAHHFPSYVSSTANGYYQIIVEVI